MHDSPLTTPRAPVPLSVHVVSHTHWDREWYHPVGRFRQRLVALVDELLDDPPPAGESFLLDGQGIVLDDYLDVRPERRAELAALLRDGRLEAGPWYVLADELIPGGEALVRNLLAGRRTLRGLRSEAPPVLYCPDSFGHPAALPLIAQGFGLDAIILWRGYGGRRWPAGDAAWWRAADGSRVLIVHLPPDGYEFGSNLPAEAPRARERWEAIRATLAPRATLGAVLLLNGADHHARQVAQRDAIAALAAAARPTRVEVGSLAGFVRGALAAARDADLPEIAGELRDSYGYTWTLQGTFGARAAQKRTNAQVERLLVRDSEPWAALARARGGASRRPLLDAAWRALLACHPHDTLCGCSIDDVARAAEARWDDAAVQAHGIGADARADLAGHDPVAARSQRAAWRPVLLVRNAAARARRGLATVAVETFLADVGVGPGSAGQEIAIPPVLPGVGLPGTPQVLDERIVHSRIESPRHYPDDDLVVRRTVIVPVAEVPGYGLRALPLDGSALHPMLEPVVLHDFTMSNGACTATVDAHGRLAVRDAAGRELPDVVALECRRDAGDLYTPSIREDGPPPQFVARRVVHAGPWRAAVAIDWRIPAAGEGEESTVTTVVSIDAGQPYVRIGVTGDHRGRDQRIRLLLRTGVRQARVWADAAFGPVERRPIVVDPDEAARETPPPTAPLHRYVSLFAPGGGATVYSDGLAEYEAAPDGTVAITLVRAVGELSRHDLPERPGNAGWPAATPAAQSPGPFAAECALLLHPGARDADVVDLIERTADEVLLPLEGVTIRDALERPADVDGVTLDGTGLAFAACKESEDGMWTVLRCANLLDGTVQGAWRLGWEVADARLARLDETPLSSVDVTGGRLVRFEAAPREVVTLLVR